MKKTLTASVFLLLGFYSQAQPTFQKIYGDASTSTWEGSEDIITTSDGGYVLAGFRNSDQYIFKINSAGDTLWTKKYATGLSYSDPFCIRQTSDGGFIVTGIYGDFTQGNDQLLFMKTNSAGVPTWTKAIGGTLATVGKSVLQTSDGGYIIGGYTYDLNTSLPKIMILKTSSAGNIQWSKTYADTESNYVEHLEKTSDGGYIIAGRSSHPIANPPFVTSDIIVMKLNSAGSISWTKKYGGTGLDRPFFIQETSDGGFILAGNTDSYNTNGDNDIFLLKTSSNGSSQWQKSYGSSTNIGGPMVYQTSDGGYMLGGTVGIGNMAAFIKTNSSGDTLWTRSYPVTINGWNSSIGHSFKKTLDGGYIFAGNIMTPGDTGSIYIVKTDANGNSNCYSPSSPVKVTAISFSPSTSSYTSGTMTASANINFNLSYFGKVTNPCATGINEEEQRINISVYPNPFSSSTEFITRGITNGTLELYDVFGRRVMQIKITGEQTTLERGNLLSGIYFYKASAENKILVTGKLIAE